MILIRSIKRLLHNAGLRHDSRIAAEQGEYRNVFCPHCGSFIPMSYSGCSKVKVEDSMIRVTGLNESRVHCPDCDKDSVVIDLRNKDTDDCEDLQEESEHEQ